MSDVTPVETASDFGSDDGDIAQRWIAEIGAAESAADYQKWERRRRKIAKLYKQDSDRVATKRRFSIFWSNIRTLQPAIYAQTPTAVVGRRWKDADAVGRYASEVLERAINYSVDAYAFDDVMKGVRDDELLFARGVPWVRYIPTIEATEPATPEMGNPTSEQDQGVAPSSGDAPDTDGQVSDDAVPGEQVTWEEVRADYVNPADFGHTSARTWDEVRAVWRRAFMTRQELIDRFGPEKGKACPLDWSTKKAGAEDGDQDETFKKAAVYEIWDRKDREAIWVCKAFTEAPLDRKPDPLQLEGFFPCPRPVYGTLVSDSLIPVPDYIFYQDQVEEIEELTNRIHLLIQALKVRGFYPADTKENLNNLMNSDTGTLIPVSSWQALMEKGGLDKMISWFPIETIANTLKSCFETRKEIIDDVYQITGISDIMRGDTDADETATAAGLKANWGSSRVRDRQKELARLARDTLRLKAQVIANQFDPKTLAAMTDVQLLTDAEKQQIAQAQQAEQQMAAQAAQLAAAQGQQPPPPPPSSIPPAQLQLMSLPSWEDVVGLLRNKALRSFRIDIETDSTIEPNDQQEKQRAVEFIEAVGQYLAKSLPVVQASPVLLPVIAEGLKWLVRRFRVGREMEDVIERAMDQLQQAASQGPPPGQEQPKGPDPQAQQMQAKAALMKAQAAQGQVQNDAGHLQLEQQRMGLEHQQAMAGVQAENNRTAADERVGMHEANVGLQADLHQQALQAVAKAGQRRLVGEINDTHPMRAPTP